jgi:hypothetical protein
MMCRDGSECSRQVCFFAHSADEIRRPSLPTVAAGAPQVLESAAAGTISAAALTGTAAAGTAQTTVSTAADLLILPGTLSQQQLPGVVPSQNQQYHLDSTGAAASDGGRPNSHGLQQQRYPSGSLMESCNSSNGQLVISHSFSNLSNSQCIDANSIMTPSTLIAHPGVVPDSSSAAEYYHLMLLNGNATAVSPAPAPHVEVQWPGMVTTHAVTAEGLQLIGSCAPPGQTLPPGTVSSMPLLYVQVPQPQQQQVPVLLHNQHISSKVTMVEPGVQVQQVHSIPVVPQPSGMTPPSVQQGLLHAGGGGNLGDPQILLQVSSAVSSQQQPGPSLASQVQLQHAAASNAQLLMLQPQEQLLLLGLHPQNLMQHPQEPQQQVQMQHLWQHVQDLQQDVFSLQLEGQQQGAPYSTVQPNTLSVPGNPAGLGAGTALVPANDLTVARPVLPATSVVFSAGCNVVTPGTQSMTCAELALPLHETAASTDYHSISCTWV